MKINYFDKNYLKFLFPQRTRLTTEYGLSDLSSEESLCSSLEKMVIKDFKMIENFMPKTAYNILDIGCGLGLINIAFNDVYSSCNFHLLDKTEDLQNEKISGFNQKYTFYNSLEATRDVLCKNGIDNDKLFTYEVEDQNINYLKTQKFDIIISLLSCGWHYSVMEYKDLILSSLNDDGLVILDIRHNTGEFEKTLDFLSLIDCVINDAESKHTGGTIGDRYFFRKK